jgi:hypothetical protein
MKTFITEITIDGEQHEGPRISALTWDEAQNLASRITWRNQGTILVGELAN